MISSALLYFGSFNPIHKGHLAIAQSLTAAGLCDELWFVVSPSNPLKERCELAQAECRFEMAQLAVAERKMNDKVKVSDIELSMPIPSYTYNTIKRLKELYPDIEFILLMGEDNIYTLTKWYKWQELLCEVEIVIYPRENGDEKLLLQTIKEMADIAGVNIDNFTYLKNAPLLKVSSTLIRERIGEHLPIDHLTTKSVEQYIIKHNLYEKKMNDIEKDIYKQIGELSALLQDDASNAELLLERAKLYLKLERRDMALNDFKNVIKSTPDNIEANSYIEMIESIDSYFYNQTYNV